MITLSKDQIKEIADFLDSGLKCYYNKKTHEVKEILDFENLEYADLDSSDWQELIDDLEENFQDYVEFEKMSSRESFQVMADFVEEVDDIEFRKRLIWSLNRAHPFRNFKDEIDYQGYYRERWFKFKAGRYIEHVESQIITYNELEEFRENEEAREEQEDLGK
jgi:acyl carrier protein